MKAISFDELVAEPDTSFVDVETKRGEMKLGSVSSADILEWMRDGEDKEKSKFAGLRLLVKSIVNPDGTRIPADRHEEAVKKLGAHDSLENRKLVAACLILNGLREKPEAAKNASGATASGELPTASPKS